MFEAFYEKLEDLSIVPVIVLEEASQAAPLAEALCRGGMPSAEVTFRTDAAAEAIRIMRQTCPEMCVGAGTVLTTEQAEQAIRAGASFVVSPGFDAGVVRYCIERDVPVLPGTVTPSEVTAARALGLTVTKFFPAEQYGGLSAIKALAAPFVGHRFMPTGGVGPANVAEYLACPSVIACGGTWMVKSGMFAEGDCSAVERAATEAMSLVRR